MLDLGCLVNRNNAPGGRAVNAEQNFGEPIDEFPHTMENIDLSKVIAIGGDLRKIEVIREFWKEAIKTLDKKPSALWINFTSVTHADTKLAACIVAVLRRARCCETKVYIIGSIHVQEVLMLCKFPKLKEFTPTKKAA